MRNETKIGILAVVAIAILIWGYKFLQGNNILTSNTVLYAEYERIDQLSASASILVNGFEVGKVSDIYLKPEDMKTIVVTMNIDRGINIPKNAKAEIISTSFVGGKAIALKFDGPCEGDGCADNGDYLDGSMQGFLESVVGNPDELDAYVGKVTGGLG
ncbi:MAG: MlaD family protein, partial [Bacteroidota bacterium]